MDRFRLRCYQFILCSWVFFSFQLFAAEGSQLSEAKKWSEDCPTSEQEQARQDQVKELRERQNSPNRGVDKQLADETLKDEIKLRRLRVAAKKRQAKQAVQALPSQILDASKLKNSFERVCETSWKKRKLVKRKPSCGQLKESLQGLFDSKQLEARQRGLDLLERDKELFVTGQAGSSQVDLQKDLEDLDEQKRKLDQLLEDLLGLSKQLRDELRHQMLDAWIDWLHQNFTNKTIREIIKSKAVKAILSEFPDLSEQQTDAIYQAVKTELQSVLKQDVNPSLTATERPDEPARKIGEVLRRKLKDIPLKLDGTFTREDALLKIRGEVQRYFATFAPRERSGDLGAVDRWFFNQQEKMNLGRSYLAEFDAPLGREESHQVWERIEKKLKKDLSGFKHGYIVYKHREAEWSKLLKLWQAVKSKFSSQHPGKSILAQELLPKMGHSPLYSLIFLQLLDSKETSSAAIFLHMEDRSNYGHPSCVAINAKGEIKDIVVDEYHAIFKKIKEFEKKLDKLPAERVAKAEVLKTAKRDLENFKRQLENLSTEGLQGAFVRKKQQIIRSLAMIKSRPLDEMDSIQLINLQQTVDRKLRDSRAAVSDYRGAHKHATEMPKKLKKLHQDLKWVTEHVFLNILAPKHGNQELQVYLSILDTNLDIALGKIHSMVHKYLNSPLESSVHCRFFEDPSYLLLSHQWIANISELIRYTSFSPITWLDLNPAGQQLQDAASLLDMSRRLKRFVALLTKQSLDKWNRWSESNHHSQIDDHYGDYYGYNYPVVVEAKKISVDDVNQILDHTGLYWSALTEWVRSSLNRTGHLELKSFYLDLQRKRFFENHFDQRKAVPSWFESSQQTGLVNQGLTCYVNTAIALIASTKLADGLAFSTRIEGHDSESSRQFGNQLMSLVCQVSRPHKQPINPIPLLESYAMAGNMRFGSVNQDDHCLHEVNVTDDASTFLDRALEQHPKSQAMRTFEISRTTHYETDEREKNEIEKVSTLYIPATDDLSVQGAINTYLRKKNVQRENGASLESGVERVYLQNAPEVLMVRVQRYHDQDNESSRLDYKKITIDQNIFVRFDSSSVRYRLRATGCRETADFRTPHWYATSHGIREQSQLIDDETVKRLARDGEEKEQRWGQILVYERI